jgi:hypothetical protein
MPLLSLAHGGVKQPREKEFIMNKVGFKKIALAASVGLAMAFTLSCSDGKDDNKGGGSKEKYCGFCGVFGKTVQDCPTKEQVQCQDLSDSKAMSEDYCTSTMSGTVFDSKEKCESFVPTPPPPSGPLCRAGDWCGNATSASDCTSAGGTIVDSCD